MLRPSLRQLALFAIGASLLPIGMGAQTSLQTNTKTEAAVYSLISGPRTTTSINGLWRFKPGDNRQYADASYDDSAWALLRSDQPWTDQGYEKLTGFAWYRFEIVLPTGNERQSLLLPRIASGYQCFIDGKLVGTEGTVPHQGAARYPMPRLIDLPAVDRKGNETHFVALRVWFDPEVDDSLAGGPQGGSTVLSSLGESTLLQRSLRAFFAQRRQTETGTLFLAFLFILAGSMCFPLYLMERSHKEYFCYAIAATAFGLSLWLDFDQLTHGWTISSFLFLSYLLGSATGYGLVLFFSHLLRIKRTWITMVATLGALSAILVFPFQQSGVIGAHSNGVLNGLGGCLFSAWVIVVVGFRASQRDLDAMLLAIPVAIDFGLLFLDSIRSIFPDVGESIEQLADQTLLSYPFEIQLHQISAGFVLLAFVSVLLLRFARIRREHNRITADMNAARSIQHLLIPDVLPEIPGLKIEAAYQPAQEVGGDFFQVIPAGPDKTLIVLGDVSGKGLPAAMTVSLVVGIIRTLVEFTTSPAAILAGLNSRLVGGGAGFTTCLAIEIARDGTMIFANAGQLAPYRNGVEITAEAALPLGIVPGLAFPELTLHLTPSDRLTLMTDGVPEAASDRELFGFARTEQLSRQSAEMIAQTARSFGQTDDITVVSIEFCGAVS